jgi:hypothetical protein
MVRACQRPPLGDRWTPVAWIEKLVVERLVADSYLKPGAAE